MNPKPKPLEDRRSQICLSRSARPLPIKMALIIEVVNIDGTLQSVSLHAQVRTVEVLEAIARRNKIEASEASHYAIFTWTLAVVRDPSTSTEHAYIVTLDPLGHEDRLLRARAALQSREDEIIDSVKSESVPGHEVRLVNGFAFLNEKDVERFRDDGPNVIFEAMQKSSSRGSRRGVSEQQSANGNGSANRTEFLPINSIGRGDKHGFLFQRSAANPREWQRRWCVLRKDDLVHCLSNLDHGDAHVIKLMQTRVKAIEPRNLGGLRHCFEIDTPKDVIQFRAKTQEESQTWIKAIEHNITLAAENEKFHLAERMIEDGQRAQSMRDEAVLERAMSSLEGLLSTYAGADRLFRFAKRSALGTRGLRNAELVTYSVDLDRAHAAFSAIPVDQLDHAGMISPSQALGTAPPMPRISNRSTSRGLFSGASVASSSGSSTGGLRGSVAALSRKEWMLQICTRFVTLFERDPVNEKELTSVWMQADELRRILADESATNFPRDVCILMIEGARKVVLTDLRANLYQDFISSPEYESVIATIPSRLRDG